MADTDSATIDFNTIDRIANHVLRFVCIDTDHFVIDTLLRKPWITEWSLLTKDTLLSILDSEEDKMWRVFPNPVADKLGTVYKGSCQRIYAEIIATDGRIMKSTFSQVNSFDINIVLLQPGVYFIQLDAGNQRYLSKIVKLDR